MSITEIITFLQLVLRERGDIEVACDFASKDTNLHYSDDLNCVLGAKESK